MPTFVLTETGRAGEMVISGGVTMNRAAFTRDTAEVKEKIDLGRYTEEDIVNPTKFVVVDQFPKAGVNVPLGTPVSLVFMAKDSIKVDDIADLSIEVSDKYAGKDVKEITDDIQKDKEIVKVLEENKEYKDLTETEKQVIRNYMVANGLGEATASDEKAGAVHHDLLFIHNI